MAGSEIKEALKSIGEKVAQYLNDAATLTVTTNTVEVAGDGKAVLAAKTVISLDGDNTSAVPIVKNDDGKPSIDTALYELHMQNVAAAVDYRARILDSMLDVIKSKMG